MLAISRKFILLLILLFVFLSCEDKNKNEYNCNSTCTDDEICTKNNKCVPKIIICDPICTDDEVCTKDNKCIPKTIICDPICTDDEVCTKDNKCIPKNECTPACKEDETCTNGACIKNNCDNCEEWEECFENRCKVKKDKCNLKIDCEDNKKCEEHNCVDIFCTPNKCSNEEICIENERKCILNTGKCDSSNNCEEGFSCNENNYCEDENGAIFTTIRELQINSSFIDKKVITKGIVSAIALSQNRNQKGLYIQDGINKHSGIYIYFIAAGETNIKVGDQVKIIGILDREMIGARIRTNITEILIISNNEEVYKKVDIDYFSNNIKDYESMLVNINLNSRFNLTQFLPKHVVFSNDNKDKILVKDTISWLNHLSLNVKLVKLIGILEVYQEDVRVLPRSELDIEILTPSCEPICKEWQSCLDQNLCILNTGMCEDNLDCTTTEGATCSQETHYCVEVPNLNNGEFEEWTAIDNPTGYSVGSALKAYKEDSKKYQTNFGAKVMRYENLKNGNNANILSPKIYVDYTKNYKLDLLVLDNDYDVDCRIYYEAYDLNDTLIGSGIPGGNDGLTKNIDNWMGLTFTTSFISQVWRGPVENLSYIRFGIRINKGHNNLVNGIPLDETLPSGYEPTGTGKIYLDSLTFEELTE